MDPKLSKLFEELSNHTPSPADAIIFLQGDRLDRVSKVLALFRAGLAPLIVITGNNAMMERRQANQENDMYLTELVEHLKQAGVPEDKLIVDDQSMNTKDQAINVVRLAQERGWRKLILVTSPYHLLRAYLTFLKQTKDQDWPGQLIMQSIKQDWSTVPSGRQKTAQEMLTEELAKIVKYQSDLASLEDQ